MQALGSVCVSAHMPFETTPLAHLLAFTVLVARPHHLLLSSPLAAYTRSCRYRRLSSRPDEPSLIGIKINRDGSRHARPENINLETARLYAR